MHPTLKIAGFAVAFGSLAALAQPVSASTGSDRISKDVRVEYRSSELMNETGARRLFKRLEHAATRACSGGLYDRRGRDFEACRRSALAQAVSSIGSPQLSAVSGSKPDPVRMARR